MVHWWQVRWSLQTECLCLTCKWDGSCSIYVQWEHSVSAARWFWSGLQTCQAHHSGVSSWRWRSWKKSGTGKRYVHVCWKEEVPKRRDKGEYDVKTLTLFSWCLCSFLLFNSKCACELPNAATLLSGLKYHWRFDQQILKCPYSEILGQIFPLKTFLAFAKL